MLLAASACRAPSAAPPRATSELVGVEWITPPQPFRAASRVTSMAALGDELVVGTADGWLGSFDRRGAIIRERWSDVQLRELVKLPGGRLLALGTRGDQGVAFGLDPHTLVTTPIALPGDATRFASVDAAVLDDGGVVITGAELPLVVYDPVTLRERRTLAPEIGWSSPIASGGALFVLRTPERQDDVYRIDLASGTRALVGPAYRLAVAKDVVARTVLDDAIPNADHAEVRVEVGGVAAFTIPGHAWQLAIDRHATRLLAEIDGELRVHELPSGRLVHRVAVWPDALASFSIELVDGRAVMASGSALRVLDLATGELSSLGGPPDGVVALAVDDAGRVSYLGSSAWQIVEGRAGVAAPIEGLLRMRPTAGVVDRYASADPDSGRAIAHTFPRGRVVQTWDLTPTAWAYPGWFDGEHVAVGVGTRGKPRLHVRGPGLASDLPLASESEVDDVDFATRRAAIVGGGRARIVRLDDGRELHVVAIPACADGHAVLEPGGTRTATYDARTLTVWDGDTVVATTTFPEDIVRVAFLAQTGELAIALERHLGLWSPRTSELRDVGVAVLKELAVSPDGRKLAVAFGDDRAALIDVAAFRGAVSVDRATAAAAPACTR